MATYSAHASAIVDQGCVIGDDTKIWHFCHVTTGAKIGPKCSLGQNVYVGGKVTIGTNVKIQNNVSIYDGVTIEDDVFCGPSMVFTNVVNPRSHVSRKHEFKTTLVKKGASLGANSTVVCGHDVGRYAFVAAGSVVTKNVPDFALVMGVPGKVVGWMCNCGVRLPFAAKPAGEAACASCGAKYRASGAGIVEA